jgi:hypothetical protein
MNADDGSEQTRLTNDGATESSPDWGSTTTSPPTDGGSLPPTTPSPEQAIDKAISAIQSLDNIPQSLKTNLIALLRQTLDIINENTTTATTLLPPHTPTNFNIS